MGLFLHFGIRTFYEGHRDFDGQVMSPERFNPFELDCDQWCQTAQQAGCKYVVFTAKHHDGFCNWPSKYTEFSVASSPWRAGQGDVVREITEACARHDLKLGLYYSPFDSSTPAYDDPQAYDDYFINQLSELLTNYGQIHMLWLDGCGSENHEYDWARIDARARELQPDILIFNMGNPDYRWVGNEDGLAPRPLWNTVAELTGSILSTDAEILHQPQWLPAECDIRMRAVSWFYSDSDVHTVKSLNELMGLYYYSVGRGANLLINLAPNRSGVLPEPDAARLLEFGDEIRRRFAEPFARISDFKQQESVWTYCPASSFLIDHLVVQEDLNCGEKVRRFKIEILTAQHGSPITVWEGYNIGHKAICHFPLVRAQAVRLCILESDEATKLSTLDAYVTTG